MKRVVTMAVVAMGLTVLTGCGVRSGLLRDTVTANQFQYQMQVTSVAYQRQATGNASVGLALCSIPLDDDTYRRAMEMLVNSAHLKPNEILANFREDTGFTYFLGFYCKQTVTLSADVLQLSPAGGATAPAPAMAPPPPPAAKSESSTVTLPVAAK